MSEHRADVPRYPRHTDEYGDTLTLTDEEGRVYVLHVAGFQPSRTAPQAVTLWRVERT